MNKPSSPLRYFLYARKSSESEDKQVASISSQIDELKKLAKENNLKIIDVLTEEKSAKAPGRTVFNQMLQDIHDGKAEGIVCWKLDRLARNPVDGGNITWMLQQGVLRHIQTFQRGYSPTDNVIMMSVEFGMANQFILDLSLNTKRGQRSKVQNGWLPHKPPIGYLNNKYNMPDNPPIYKDPKRFHLVKKLWDILLEKKCTLDELYVIANKMGLISFTDDVYAQSSFHRLFRNPFYYGHFVWNGETYEGKHEPMISKTEFDLVQRLLNGRGFTRKKEHVFAFTGLMRCGQCGASITAEDKEKHQKNGNVHFYSYYRCTKRIKRDCSEKPISSKELEAQIFNVLGKIHIPAEFHQWAIKYLREEHSKEITDREGITQAQRKCLDNCFKRLDTLFNMRLNGEITPEEFKSQNEKLLGEKNKYEELLKDTSHRQETWLDRAEKLFSFAEKARQRFENGTLEDKREILATLGSNLLLTNRELKVPLDNDLAMFLEVAPEVQALHNRLEPLQMTESTMSWEDLYNKNEKWGE
jgi:site-specific DNA recombinase